MRKRVVTVRVFVDGRLSSKLKVKRVIRWDDNGEYIVYNRRHRVRWIGNSPVVDVYRTSMVSRNRGDSPESIGAYARRPSILSQVQYGDGVGVPKAGQ